MTMLRRCRRLDRQLRQLAKRIEGAQDGDHP